MEEKTSPVRAKINGRRYDTATAKMVGVADNGDRLFVKTTGEYFLCLAAPEEYGGPGLKNPYIRPIDGRAAADWAKANLPAGVFDAEFISPPARSSLLRAYLPVSLIRRVKADALSRGENISEWVEHACRAQLEKKP